MGAEASNLHPKLTPERAALIAKRWRDGWPMARMFRVHKNVTRDVIHSLCAATGCRQDELGAAPRQRARKWTPKETETLREMLAKGATYAEIAKHLKRTSPSVKRKAEDFRTEAAQSEPHATQTPRNTRPRKCLLCESMFESEGPHNRLCDFCRNNGVYRSIASLTTGIGRR